MIPFNEYLDRFLENYKKVLLESNPDCVDGIPVVKVDDVTKMVKSMMPVILKQYESSKDFDVTITKN